MSIFQSAVHCVVSSECSNLPCKVKFRLVVMLFLFIVVLCNASVTRQYFPLGNHIPVRTISITCAYKHYLFTHLCVCAYV